MNFSEFAHMMKSYIFTEKTIPDFLIHLIDQIMQDPYSDEDRTADKEDRYNPMCKYHRSKLSKIYNGKNDIPEKGINKICSHIDKDKFSDYRQPLKTH